jgi:hypothetical protein
VIVEESDTVTPNEVDVEQIDAFSVVQSLSGGSEEKVGILSGPTLSG